jgi:hypothetical protein
MAFMKRRFLAATLLLITNSNLLAGTLTNVQSIRITNTRADWFYLEELRIFNDQGEDVASLEFGTTAMASEDPAFGGVGEGPIDDIYGICHQHRRSLVRSRFGIARMRVVPSAWMACFSSSSMGQKGQGH